MHAAGSHAGRLLVFTLHMSRFGAFTEQSIVISKAPQQESRVMERQIYASVVCLDLRCGCNTRLSTPLCACFLLQGGCPSNL